VAVAPVSNSSVTVSGVASDSSAGVPSIESAANITDLTRRKGEHKTEQEKARGRVGRKLPAGDGRFRR
jgi:hypothetical protein